MSLTARFQKLIGRDREGRYWLQEPGQRDLEVNESIARGMLERGEAGDDGTVARAIAPPPPTPLANLPDYRGEPVSLLSSGLAKLGISKTTQRGLTSLLVPAPLRAAHATLSPFFGGGGAAPAGGVVSPYGGFQPAGVGGGIGSAIGGVIGGELIRRFAPGGGGAGKNGCGCSSDGRDPCTRQKMTSQRAPQATFFGGCCPPGRTLRRISGGRDICMRTPRMNPFNPRALARADRRVLTFARRAAPIMKDLGFQVSRTRRPKIKVGKARKRSRG